MENCDNKECPICMELITSNNCCTTECNHTFHSSCLFKNFANSAGCPLCRKELIVYPEESDSEDESDDDEVEVEGEGEEEEEPVSALTLNQILNVIKKHKYTEKDLLNSILMHVYYEDDEVNDEMLTKNDNLTDLLFSIFNKEVAVDYRDSRTYASVILGLPKTDEIGEGPKPIF